MTHDSPRSLEEVRILYDAKMRRFRTETTLLAVAALISIIASAVSSGDLRAVFIQLSLLLLLVSGTFASAYLGDSVDIGLTVSERVKLRLWQLHNDLVSYGKLKDRGLRKSLSSRARRRLRRLGRFYGLPGANTQERKKLDLFTAEINTFATALRDVASRFNYFVTRLYDLPAGTTDGLLRVAELINRDHKTLTPAHQSEIDAMV